MQNFNDKDKQIFECYRKVSMFLIFVQISLFISHATLISKLFDSFENALDQSFFQLLQQQSEQLFKQLLVGSQVIDAIMVFALIILKISLYFRKYRFFLIQMIINLLTYFLWLSLILFWIFYNPNLHNMITLLIKEKKQQFFYFENLCHIDDNINNQIPSQLCQMESYYLSVYQLSVSILGLSFIIFFEDIYLGYIYFKIIKPSTPTQDIQQDIGSSRSLVKPQIQSEFEIELNNLESPKSRSISPKKNCKEEYFNINKQNYYQSRILATETDLIPLSPIPRERENNNVEQLNIKTNLASQQEQLSFIVDNDLTETEEIQKEFKQIQNRKKEDEQKMDRLNKPKLLSRKQKQQKNKVLKVIHVYERKLIAKQIQYQQKKLQIESEQKQNQNDSQQWVFNEDEN